MVARCSREDRQATNKEVRREELGIKEPSNNAVIETMELLLMGVRNRLSKEVTVKLDFSVKKQLAVTSWKKGIPAQSTQVGKKCVCSKNCQMASATGTFRT